MENQVVDAVSLGQSVMAHDMSVWGLFVQAGLVVKVIMIGLLLSSVWVWAIVFEKMFRLRKLRAQANQFEEAFWSGGSLEDLYDRIADRPKDPMAAIFVSAMRE
jgi:biopolymer transport protein TolQ